MYRIFMAPDFDENKTFFHRLSYQCRSPINCDLWARELSGQGMELYCNIPPISCFLIFLQ